MSIKSDKWIKKMSINEDMINPFSESQVRLDESGNKLISYGVSSYGYDVRCSNEFKVFTNIHSAIVDPKSFDEKSFVNIESDVCVIPPNSFALARTIEYFKIPRNVLTVCLGKSTYARCGIIVNVTPLEPEWEGHVTLEFSNTLICQQKFMLERVLLRCYFLNQMRSVKQVIKIEVANIKGKQESRYPKLKISLSSNLFVHSSLSSIIFRNI